MKRIVLMELELRNFKGLEYFLLDLDGRDAFIYGDNAAGKTTVYDALTWLLFGKDSAGRGDFEIKPLAADGSVADHAAVTAVEALLEVDGAEVRLRKEYYEKWSSKRGSSVKTFDGNTCDYYLDQVPVKKNEFDRQVQALVEGEEIFRALTGTGYFCSAMKWQDRRRILFELCGVAEDGEILASDPQFAPLVAALGGRTVEGLRKALEAQRKGYNAERETIPVRLDECKRTVEALRGLDFAVLRRERDGRQEEANRLRGELLALEHDTLLDQKTNELQAVVNELTALERENQAYRAAQQPQDGAKGEELDRAAAKAEGALRAALGRQTVERDLIAKTGARVEECRHRWRTVKGETFQAEVCPTCGQPMPQEAQARAEEEFRRRQEGELQSLVEVSQSYKAVIAQAEYRLEQAIQDAVEAENSLAMARDGLEALAARKPAQVADKPGYREAQRKLEGQKWALQDQIEALGGKSEEVCRDILEKIRGLEEEMAAIGGSLAQEETLERAQRRMEELRESARATAAKLEELDGLLDLCGEYVRYKTRYIEGQVNRRFRKVRWKLFDEQANGGVAQCCEATVDGVPYGSLNNGSRINAGLDVISALGEYYGVSVPLVIDNAESVTRLLPMDCQVILLEVRAGEKSLRVEVK